MPTMNQIQAEIAAAMNPTSDDQKAQRMADAFKPLAEMGQRRQFWPKPITFDRSLFVVLRHFGDLGMEGHSEPYSTRETIAAEIVVGEIDRVVAVFEMNPVEGWSRDCTADVAELVEAMQLQRAAE